MKKKLNKIFRKMSKKETTVEENKTENPELENEETTTNSEEQDELQEVEGNDQELDPIVRMEQELEEQKDKYLRLFSEFTNYKKRTSKEYMELRNVAARETMMAILPALDDFDRSKNGEEDQWTEGVKLVFDKLHKALESKGLKAMETNGEAFNPDFHEAITEIPAPSDDMKGKIIDTIEKGYLLNDKIIRYAKVVVGK